MADSPLAWFEAHPIVLVVGGIAVAFLVLPKVLKLGQQNAVGNSSQIAGSTGNATTASDNSGLTNGIAYVPTQTIFTTNNRTVDSVVNSPNSTNSTPTTNVTAPNATTVSSTQTTPVTQTSNTTTNTTSNTTVTPIIVIPPGTIAPKPPNPTPVQPGSPPRQGTPTPVSIPKGQLAWSQNYTIKSGDTLSGIAQRVTQAARSAGMPTSMSVTYNDIYAHNTAVINATSAKHGNPIHGFATPQQINNIFPGEVITVPLWQKG